MVVSALPRAHRQSHCARTLCGGGQRSPSIICAPMKLKLVLFAFVCVIGALNALAEDLSAAAQKEARNYAQALMASDYARVLAYTHERVITRMGEKEAALAL